MTLANATFVVFGGIDWNFIWQSHQEVPARLATRGHRVMYVENTGIRRPGLRDAGRVVSRFRNWFRSRGTGRATTHGVDVLSPLLIPLPYSAGARFVNTTLLVRSIRRWIGPRRNGPLVVITFLPTPLVRSVVEALGADLVVYYAVDALAESSTHAARLAEHQATMMREAAIVFTTSTLLQDAARDLGIDARLLEHGVRCDDFERARNSPHALAERLSSIPRPIVGFVGSIRHELDLDIVHAAAVLAPDLHFVFVGPAVADVRALQQLPNVHFIGQVPHAEVSHLMVGFDVGILPYQLTRYTAHILPAKFKEYLAAGLPVVATRLHQVRAFAEQHRDTVTFADDAASLVAAIRDSIAENNPQAIAHRTAVASQYDWERQINTIRDAIVQALGLRGRAA